MNFNLRSTEGCRPVMRTKKNLFFWSVGLNLFLLAGCHFGRESTVLSPLSNFSARMRAGAKQRELPESESAKLCFTTAESLEKGGKDREAISLYEEARQVDKHLASEVTRRLAVLYDRNGEFDKALDEYRRGLLENPKDAHLLNDLGYGYYCRGKWAEAEKNLRKAVAANPQFALAWNNLGMTLGQQNKYDESLQAFEKVVPKAQAHCNLAFIQAAQAKYEEARHSYEAALQLEPGLQIARIALQKMNQPNQPTSRSAAPSLPRLPSSVQPDGVTDVQPDLDAPVDP